MIDFETIVLRSLLTNTDYLRRVIPYIKPNYFTGVHSKLFKTLSGYVAKYNKLPTEEAFVHAIQNDNQKYTSDETQELNTIVVEVFKKNDADIDWLINETEKWCQDRAIFNAIMESIDIINKPAEKNTHAIPDLLKEALSVTFDANVGHDYTDNWDSRYNFYHESVEKIPFDIDYLNRITNGGLTRKTLNVLLAGTGVGKSLCMCHLAASYLTQGFNVLYVTAEMSEERIAERIDANLFDVPIDQLYTLSKEMFKNNINKIIAKTSGKLVVKEYPTGQAHAGHIRALLNELKLKKNFTPDIIVIDYLNIFASSRIRSMGGSINSYNYVKAIAEEMRGLAVEFDVPLITATQVNRSGFSNSDPGLEDTSESFGLPATADLFLSIYTDETLRQQGKYLFKQLKTRYGDLTKNQRFLVGVDYPKMRLYDIPDSEQYSNKQQQEEEEDKGPVFDNSEFGGRKFNKPMEGINV